VGYTGGVRLERHDGYWLVIGPAAPGAAATTIWSAIFIRARAVANQRLLRHELVHVRQWHDHGFLGFAVRYLGAYLGWRVRRYPHWAAYRRVPFEIEAEWQARRTSGAATLAGAAPLPPSGIAPPPASPASSASAPDWRAPGPVRVPGRGAAGSAGAGTGAGSGPRAAPPTGPAISPGGAVAPAGPERPLAGTGPSGGTTGPPRPHRRRRTRRSRRSPHR
jgi:hypothetical protein